MDNKKLIWSGDVTDYLPDENECEDGHITEEIWDQSYEIMHDDLDEILNQIYDKVPVKNNEQIVGDGSIQRWDREIKPAWYISKHNNEKNIKDFIHEVISAFDGDNTFYLYTDDEDILYLYQYGHDNPTNPSIITFRILNNNSDEDDLFDNDDLTYDSIINNSKIVKYKGED